jgi:hypothetical protein
MDYASIVKAAWDNDPTFVELCKTLWGSTTTAEQVVAFAKDGPDVSSVHVPGGDCGCRSKRCKHRMPTLDDRGIAKVSPSLQHDIPKSPRQYKRDDGGRFAAVGEIASNATIAAAGGIGAGLGLNHARGDAHKLGRLISELKASKEGRVRLARALANREVAGRAGKLGLLAAGSMVVGAAAGHHGKEAYEGIRDHMDLEAEHHKHVAALVRHDDIRSFTQNNAPQDLHARTRGARRDAVTNVFTPDAHPEGNVAVSFRDTANYRRQQREADRREHERQVAREFGKSAEELTGSLTQVDPDKRQVFGWASIVEKDGEPVVDLQGDYIGIDELEKSAYEYVHKSRIGGAMHRRVGPDGQIISKTDAPYHAADLIESFVVTPDKIEKMGLPESTPVGWWVGFKVNDDEVWKSVKSGDWKGFSIHGAGKRKPMGEVSSFDITGAELTR